MSMDKEELMADVPNAMKDVEGTANSVWRMHAVIAVNILRAVIALLEIRESIDDLSANIAQVGKSIDDLRTMLFQTRSPWPSRIDDQGKDIRSAGIG